LGRNASCGFGFEEAHGFGIDAEPVGGSIFDERLGIDGPGEMHVQVSALGHTREESIEFEGAQLRGIEGTNGTLFARCRGDRVFGCGLSSGAGLSGGAYRRLRDRGDGKSEQK
jgi:hypothetical protein